MTAGQEFVRPGDGEAHEVLRELTNSLGRLILLNGVEAVMSCDVELVVRWVDAEAVDVHHARRDGGWRAFRGVRRTGRGQSPGQGDGEKVADQHTDTFRSRDLRSSIVGGRCVATA